MFTPPIALTIAGSDPSGGAGIQADLKAFSANGAYGAAVMSVLTAQNTKGVTGIHAPPPEFVALQIKTVMEDLPIGALKFGMLFSAEIIDAVAETLQNWPDVPIVLDPVMVSTSGHKLLQDDAVAALIDRLLPMATLVTPNLHEAALLSSLPLATDEAGIAAQAEAILEKGAKAVLIKGGHGEGEKSVDYLFKGGDMRAFTAKRVPTQNTHGTGCTLSAAITAELAKGAALEEAVEKAKAYLTRALEAGREMKIGGGFGPPHHFADMW